MKRLLSAAAISAALVMTGCDRGTDDKAAPVDATEVPTEATAAAGPAEVVVPSGPAAPAAAGAPEFAVIYPGGTPKAPATSAQGPAGPGGILGFTTEATPAQVIAFYRQRAEASGLKPINTMTRDETQAYSAGDGGSRLMNVIATAMEDGPTDVQLSWSAGT